MVKKEEIRAYWDERARDNRDGWQATTNDRYLRELEMKTLVRELSGLGLPPASEILDVGCGDGLSTLHLAEALPLLSFTGADYSPEMIESAKKYLAARTGLKKGPVFKVADALALGDVFDAGRFRAVLSGRCLINLQSYEDQKAGIAQVARVLAPGGHYIAIENFMEGQHNMNRARAELGLPEIPVRWHNLFFTESGFLEAAKPWFEGARFLDFSSSYYFATRLLYSAMCKAAGEEPDYNHDIHRLAVDLPWTGVFSPIRMVILKKRQ